MRGWARTALCACVCFGALSMLVTSARAQVGLPIYEVPANQVRIDGALRDWRGVRFIQLGSGADASMRFALGYDGNGLYFGANVIDDRLIRSRNPSRDEDAIVVTLAMPRGERLQGSELWLFAGVSGRSAAVAQIGGIGERPRRLPGAQIVEGPREGGQGYVLEAFVPWRDIPGGSDWQRGRAAVRLRDVDREARPEVEDEPATATADRSALDRLPALVPNGGEAAALRTFLSQHGLESGRARFDLRGDVIGDRRPERVAIYDRFVVVVGPGVAQGRGFSYLELPASGADPVRDARLRDMTGDGRPELVLTMHQQNELGARDVWSIFSFASGTPASVFGIETRKETSGGFIQAALDVHAGRRGSAASIAVRAGRATLDASSYRESPASDVEAIVLPWGAVIGRTYRWDGQRFAVVDERANPNPAPSPSPSRVSGTAGGSSGSSSAHETVSAPRAAPPPSTAQLLASFRRERSIPESVRARFEQHVNIADDSRPEHVLILGKALVIVGPGFRGGRGYFYWEVPVDSPEDVLGMRVADVTGDACAEVVLRARQIVGDVTREILLVHQLTGRGFPRLLAAEVGRAQGGSRIENEVRIGGHALEVRPGRARGWSAGSYPFTNEPPTPGYASLLLPWRDHAIRYRYQSGRLAP